MSENSRKKDVTTEIVVGAFMFTMLVVLLTITVVMSQNKFFEKSWTLKAEFPDVGGLKEGESVFLRGVKIGNVDKIEVAEDESGVELEMRLDRPVTLYEGYKLQVETASMLGGMRLVIDEGDHSGPKIPEDQLMNLKGEPTPDLLETANLLVGDLREITSQISSGKGTIGRLIYEDGLYAEAEGLVKSLNETAADLEIVSENARLISDRLATGKGTLGRLLSEDEGLFTELTNTVANVNAASGDIRKIVARVEKGEGTLGRLLSSDDQVYKDLSATVESLRSFSESLNNDEGTVARLLSDDTLYIKVEGLVDEARATIDDFRETSPITTFSTIFFGAF